MTEDVGLPGSLYLGLATAIAAFSAAAVALDLLTPSRRIARLVSITVVLCSVLGITAAFIAVARDEATATLHVTIAAGLVVPGIFVLVRALDEIVTRRDPDDASLDGIRVSPSLPAAEVQPSRRQRRDLLAATATVATAVVALLVATTPELLDTIFSPERRAPPSKGGFSPGNRPAFSCLEAGRDCPGPGYPAFNSYLNTPSYGDERAFVDARRESSAEGTYANVVKVNRGDRVLVRAYFNNNGDARYEASPGDSIARNTRMLVLLPLNARKVQAIAASITASNARPQTVSDTVTLWSDDPFEPKFVERSARLYNDAYPRGIPVPDDLVSDGQRATRGALVGFRKLDGVVAGRFEEAGLVICTVETV
jgi:hypothetical protein